MEKLTVTSVDDLVLHVLTDQGGEATLEDFTGRIDAKESTVNAAIRRCVQRGAMARVGRGKFASPDPAVTALLDEAKGAGFVDIQPHGTDRCSISLETLRALLEG